MAQGLQNGSTREVTADERSNPPQMGKQLNQPPAGVQGPPAAANTQKPNPQGRLVYQGSQK